MRLKSRYVLAGSILSILFLLLIIGMTYAKYASRKNINSDATEISHAYYLTLLNPDASDYLNLTIGNMHPNETKQLVFCVSNREPDSTETEPEHTGGSDFGYELELLYTENLPIQYQITEVEPVLDDDAEADFVIDGIKWDEKGGLSGEDISDDVHEEILGDNAEDSFNQGRYWLYKKDSSGTNLHLSSPEGIGYERDYYVMQITWNDDVQNITDYLKETDLIYILVKALQPKPVKE